MRQVASSVVQDLRYALRQFRRAPGFAVTATVTLALGVGVNTAIFSLLDQALLRSLPVHRPQELVVLQGTGKAWEGHSSTYGGDTEAYFSVPMYRDLRDSNHVFSGLLATARADIALTHHNSSQAAQAELVSGNYFQVLGVQPVLERAFTSADDDAPGAHAVAVLAFDFWRDQLGGDARLVGSTVQINGHPFQIVGVAAPHFRSAIWGENPSVFLPITMVGEVLPGKDVRLTDHKDRWINILGRLQPGMSRPRAEAAINPLWHALRAEELKALGSRSKRFTDEFLTHSRLRLVPGARGFSYQRDDFKAPLLVVMSMALLVLVIAATNVASLLTVRSAYRSREFSLRSALGAGGGRILQQLLLEGLLLGITGGLAGMMLAPIATRALIHQLAGDQTNVAFTTSVDVRLLFFSLVTALLVSGLFSFAPALQLHRPDLTGTLRQTSGTPTGGLLKLRRVVVCLQIGLSVLLLVGAGLFVRTMQKLRRVDLGFNSSHLVTFGIDPRLARYAPDAIPPLQERITQALQALPGVQSVGATNDAELTGDSQGGNVSVEGYRPPADSDVDVERANVSPSYFSTLQMPMLMGRSFSEDDTARSKRVAVVNESFAKRFCETPRACLGRQVANGSGNTLKLDTEIVGIVRDAKHYGVRDQPTATLFRPLKQASPERLFLYLRTSAPPGWLLPEVRRTMQQIDSTLAITDLRTMEAQIDDNLVNERMISLLAVSFGVLAAVLAGVGLYGVLAFSTAQRTREIGVRLALGSSRGAISQLVLRDVVRLAALGVGLSLPVTLLLTHLLRSQLFGVASTDPISLGVAVGLIVLVCAAAAFVPARRAAAVDPMQALRTE